MTGFDVPSLTTIYLDKPMRNHTLMQTIARANRVFADKTNGLIVDYVGVFRNLQKALAIYGAPTSADMADGDEDEDTPIKDKSELVATLRQYLADLDVFADLHGIDVPALLAATGFTKAGLLDDAVDTLVANDDIRKQFLSNVAQAALLYRAILPDTSAGEFTAAMSLYVTLSKKIRALSPEPDTAGIMAAIEKLLDASIASEGYVINEKPRRLYQLATSTSARSTSTPCAPGSSMPASMRSPRSCVAPSNSSSRLSSSVTAPA